MSNKITDLKQSFKDASPEVRNQLAIQFEPLVNKIVAQQFKIFQTDWNILKSMAYEGLVNAMNTYEPDKKGSTTKSKGKGMDFKQYAAFMILNNIRNKTAEELNVVKLNGYAIANMKKEEVGTFVSVSISNAVRDNDSDTLQDRNPMALGLYETAKFADGDVFGTLKTMVDANMKPIDAEVFYRYFGICGYEEVQIQEIAEEMGVTSGRISQRVRTVIDYIKSEPILCESLASLLSK